MDKWNVFVEDIEIPDVVQKKANAAFSQIRKEKGEEMNKNDIESNTNKENAKVVRVKVWKKTAVAVAACAVLATSIGLGNFYPRGNQTAENEMEQTTNFEMNTNPFVLTVRAAGLEGDDYRKLECGKPVAVNVNANGWVIGEDDDGDCSFCINLPFSCDGEGIESVKYKINKGAFQVVEKEGAEIIVAGTEISEELNVGMIGGEYDEENNGGELYPVSVKYYSEFTLDYEKQSSDTTWINMCNEVRLSDMDLIWGENSTVEDCRAGYQELIEGTIITCTVLFEDGTSQEALLEVGTVVTTAKEAGFDHEEEPDEETVFFTFNRKE